MKQFDMTQALIEFLKELGLYQPLTAEDRAFIDSIEADRAIVSNVTIIGEVHSDRPTTMKNVRLISVSPAYCQLMRATNN